MGHLMFSTVAQYRGTRCDFRHPIMNGRASLPQACGEIPEALLPPPNPFWLLANPRLLPLAARPVIRFGEPTNFLPFSANAHKRNVNHAGQFLLAGQQMREVQ